MQKDFVTSRRRRGMTLIEAVVGTALLGSLLVGILTADSRQRRQTWRAERRIEACSIADEWLETWWPKRDRMPRSGGGPIELLVILSKELLCIHVRIPP